MSHPPSGIPLRVTLVVEGGAIRSLAEAQRTVVRAVERARFAGEWDVAVGVRDWGEGEALRARLMAPGQVVVVRG